MTQERRFYIVRGKALHGTITHLCPTATMAFDTLKRFQQDGVQNIQLFDPDGFSISAVELEAIVAGLTLPKSLTLSH